MPILAKQFHVIAIDLPGQGASEKPASGYDTRTAGQRVHALLQALGETNYVFVGHDVGSAPDLYELVN